MLRASLLCAVLALPCHASELKIIALGDSTTAGAPYFQSPKESPPDGKGDPKGQYVYWMMKSRPGWAVLNYGVSGERTDDVRVRFERDVLKEKPKYVVILAGANDASQGRDLKETEADLLWMYETAALSVITPVACTIPPFTRSTNIQAQAIQELNAWIKDKAEALKIPFCDLSRVVADKKDHTRLKSSPDGLHPDLKGYRAIGEALVKTIDALEKP